MKLRTVSIALLALPASLAAVAANYNSEDDASPTRPDIELRVPQPTPQAHDCHNSPSPPTETDADLLLLHQQQKAKRNNDVPIPTTVSISSTSSLPSSSSSSSSAPPITKIAVFTADGVPYTVTSANGQEKVNGVTLATSGEALIGGVDVAEATKGNGIVAGGTTVRFRDVVTSSSAPPPVASSVSGSPSGSASASASSSSSSMNAGARATAGAMGQIGLAVGAIVGGFML